MTFPEVFLETKMLFSLSVSIATIQQLALDSLYPVATRLLGKLVRSQHYSYKSPQSTKKISCYLNF